MQPTRLLSILLLAASVSARPAFCRPRKTKTVTAIVTATADASTAVMSTDVMSIAAVTPTSQPVAAVSVASVSTETVSPVQAQTMASSSPVAPAAAPTSSSVPAASVASAAPAQATVPVQSNTGLSVTGAIIQAISPNSASCDGAPAQGQCRTADEAAGPISRSFAKYGITSKAEAAAIISLMAFESVDFKYNVNVSPGRPGQGTRNMQMINFNVLYAQSIPALASQVSSITGGASGASLPADKANSVRSLLTGNDDYDFGSGAWFLTTQCSAAVRSQLQTGSLAGWQQYISSCVGTTVTDDRQAYWSRAVAALS